MHARNRTWPLGSDPAERCRQRTLPVEGGDGSTLSLDFTTGVLDPRLTFTRSTNATFINSSGLVEWAAANMVANSAWNDATATPSGWSAFGLSATATVAIASDPEARTIAVTTGAGNQPFLFVAPAVSQGIVYTVSVEIVSVTHGSGPAEEVQYSQVLSPPFATAFKYYMNGVEVGTSGNGSAKVTQTGVLTVVYTAGSSSQIRIGFAAAPRNNCSITVKAPQHQPGEAKTRTAFFRRTAAEGAYYAPRFDHDPTTLAPRGLLIEGSSDNQVRNSNDIYNASFWGSSVGVTATQDTTIPDPSGGTTTCKIVKSAGVQYVVRNQPLPTLTVPANSTVNLTASVWLRMDGAGQVSPHLGIYDAAGASFGTRSGATVSNSAVTIDSGSAAIAAYTFGSVTGWVRCSVSRSFTNATGSPVTFTQLSIYIYPNQVNTNATTIYAWGAQVESGVGASSLIPTGASTGSRAADVCYIANSDFGFSTNGGTFLAEWNRGSNILSGSSSCNAMSTDYASGRWLGMYTAGASSTGTAGSWSGYLNSSGAVSGINKMAVSYSSWIASASGNMALNGGSVVSGTLTLGTTPTYLMIGAASASSPYSGGGFRDPLNNSVRRIKYWPSVLPTAQLQALTT